jgi:FkbM family methyltransferase
VSDHDPTFAPKLTSLLQRSGRARRTFVDGGACNGDFTSLLLATFPDAAIHAFEPNPELSASLAKRFANLPNVHVWNLALREAAGRATLHLHADPGTTSLLDRSAGKRRYYHSSDRVVASTEVRTVSLDAFIAEQAPEGLGLLKLDTQGSELAILRGAAEALRNAAIEVIYTEFFVVPHYEGAPLLGDLLALLGQFGYSLFDLFKGPNATNGQLRFGDAVFVSPSFRAAHVDTFVAEP